LLLILKILLILLKNTMTLITITECDNQPNRAKVTVNRQGLYEVTLSNPFNEDEQTRLDWYFEEYLKQPYIKSVQAEEAARSLVTYGTKLFEQLFSHRLLYGHYMSARQQHGLKGFQIEIIGSAEFQRLYWEALYDPELQQFIAHHAPFSRSAPHALAVNLTPRPSPTLNLLLVILPNGIWNSTSTPKQNGTINGCWQCG